MSTPYLVTLLVLVATIGMARGLLPVLPSRRVSVRLHAADVVLCILGVLALAFHCGAMFYRSSVQSLPGAAKAVSEIDALGTASIIAFAVPAVLVSWVCDGSIYLRSRSWPSPWLRSARRRTTRAR
jgi:hypothetical protein